MATTHFNPILVEKFTAKQFEKWFKKMGYEGKWEDAWKSIGGKIKKETEEE